MVGLSFITCLTAYRDPSAEASAEISPEYCFDPPVELVSNISEKLPGLRWWAMVGVKFVVAIKRTDDLPVQFLRA